MYKINNKTTISDSNDRRLYEVYREEVELSLNSKESILKEINLLNNFLEFCKKMSNHNNETFLINEVKFYPLIFVIYKKYKEDENKIFDFCSVIYIILFCQNRITKITDYLKKFLFEIKSQFLRIGISKKENLKYILHKFFNTSKKDEIKKIMNKSISKISDIDLDKSSKSLIIYFLSKIEELRFDKKIELNDKKYNIEHMMAKNPDEPQIDIEYWYLNVEKLKNLLLIESNINNELKNYNWNKKREVIFNNEELKTKIRYTKSIFEKEEQIMEILEKKQTYINEFVKEFSENIFQKIEWIWDED